MNDFSMNVALLKGQGKSNIYYRNWTKQEQTLSSTCRDLEATHFSLSSSIKHFKNKEIFWHTDNFACRQVVKTGSSKRYINDLETKVFNLTSKDNIDLLLFWIGMENNNVADEILTNFDDWFTAEQLIRILEIIWDK